MISRRSNTMIYSLLLIVLARYQGIECAMSNFVLRRPSDASFITQPTVQPAPRSPSLSTCSMMCANDPTCNVFSTDYNDGCKLGQLAGGAVEAAPAHGTQVMADASLFGPRIVVFGWGSNACDFGVTTLTVDARYNPTPLPPSPIDGSQFGFVSGDWMFYCYFKDCWASEIGVNNWVFRNSFEGWHKFYNGVDLGDMLWIGGGLDTFDVCQVKTETMDKSTEVWSFAADMPEAVNFPTFVKIGYRKAMLLGGEFQGGAAATRKAWIYDFINPAAGYQKRADMPEPKYLFSASYWKEPSTEREYVFTFGGKYFHNPVLTETKRVGRYDLHRDEWHFLMDLPDFSATRVSNIAIDGRIFFIYRGIYSEYFPENNTFHTYHDCAMFPEVSIVYNTDV